jgi:hypothetical protein
MSNINLRNLSNDFLDVRLVSLAGWRQASEITPRDRGGPYMVLQEGYDPQSTKPAADEYVLGRSGKWLLLSLFFKMSVEDRRAEFVFGTAAEVMAMMQGLPSKAVLFRPGEQPASDSATPETDDMAAAFQAARSKGSSSGSGQA